ncbi:MAG: hypothetical protein JSW67_13770 [Candidatus Latescibacterota bacterium]|nr:MAG: hypothetical protein JSW67_13770 [Candidatus Latescibacterota bacterium]
MIRRNDAHRILCGLLLAVTFTAASARSTQRTATALQPQRITTPHRGAFLPAAQPSLEGSAVEYLIITSQEMASAFAPLAEWKTRKGVPAVVRTLADVEEAAEQGSDLAETVRNYIRDAYLLWGVRFVLLGGDTDVIPSRYVTMQLLELQNPVTELYYSGLDGNWNDDGDAFFGEPPSPDNPDGEADFDAEVYLGRAPVSTLAEAELFVDKTLRHETPPDLGFQDELLLLAEVLFPTDYVPGGPPPSADGAVFAEEIAALAPPWARVTRLYEAAPLWPGSAPLTTSSATQAINSGFGTVVHIGHGWRYTLSCGDGSLDVGDAVRFNNSRRAGLFYLLNCTATAFDFESMAEALLLNPAGGATAVVGAAREAFPLAARQYQARFFEHLYVLGERQVGVAMTHSREYFITPTLPTVDRWTQLVYTLLGDPELPLWTRARDDLQVNGVPETLSLGRQELVVEVRNAEGPLLDALVCLQKLGEEYRVARTDASGLATFTLELVREGDVQLTVTAPDHVPVQRQVPALAQDVSLVVLEAGIVDDGGTAGIGNLDGRVDAGETAGLAVRVQNAGSALAPGFTAELRSHDSAVEVLRASARYADLIAGAEAVPDTAFVVRVAPDVGDGSLVTLEVDLQLANGSESRRVEFVVHAARVALRGLRLDDTRAGDADGVQDAGEEVDLYYTLENRGSGAALSAQVLLETPQAGLEVLVALADFAEIAPGAQVESTTPLTIREMDVAAAHSVRLRVAHLQSPAETGVWVDFRPPPVPAEVTSGSVATADVVNLGWAAVDVHDLLGYHVYRSESETGTFVRINSSVVPQAYFRDVGLEPSMRYFYKVSAVDAAWLEGESGAVVSVSTNPPLLDGWPIDTNQFTASTPGVGDVDADGVLDVVVGADQIFVWDADGIELLDADSNPRTWGVFFGDFQVFGSMTVADLDAEPGREIVAATWDVDERYAVVLDANGQPTPGWPQPLVPVPEALRGSQVPPVVANLDASGAPEILIAARDGRLYGWHADGSEIADGDLNPATSGVLLDTGAAFLRSAPGVADLDPDRPGLEIALGSTNGLLYVLDAQGRALPGWPRATFGGGIPFGTQLLSGVSIADLDRDGRLEMIFLESEGRLHAMHLDGSELAGFPVEGITAIGISVVPSPAIGDLQGDADLEVVVAGSDGAVHLFDAAGQALFAQPIVAGAASESSPVLGDVDNDGEIEIVFGDDEGIVHVWNLDGTDVDGFPLAIGSEARATPVLTDLDGDGLADLVTLAWDGLVRVQALGVPWEVSRFPWPEHRGNAHRTGVHGYDVPTPVTVTDLQAQQTREGGVLLSWRGAATQNDRAWRILRAGPFEREPQAHTAWIGAASQVGEMRGNGELHFVDTQVERGAWYAYALVTIEGERESIAGTIALQVLAPSVLALHPASPNPFNPGTRIAFDLPGATSTPVRLAVYDIHGRRVKLLLQATLRPGPHAVDWNGHDDLGRPTGSGVYVVRLQTSSDVLTRKLTRIR